MIYTNFVRVFLVLQNANNSKIKVDLLYRTVYLNLVKSNNFKYNLLNDNKY